MDFDSSSSCGSAEPRAKSSNPAHALWVELTTRIATQRLHYRSGDEENAAESIHAFFGIVRDLMKANPDDEKFQELAPKLLNDVLRPYTARWDGWLTEEQDGLDKDGESKLKFKDEWVRKNFRRELRELQPRLLGYAKAFQKLAKKETPDSWWTDPNPAQLQELSDELKEAIKVSMGEMNLAAGIQSQVKFSHCSEIRQAELTEHINQAEWKEIRSRRREMVSKEDEKRPIANATGLALSGGGIRSATFCLGIVQVLARRGFLKQFDYLSTVSGGGYLGSFLTDYLGTPPEPAAGETEAPKEPKERQVLSPEDEDKLVKDTFEAGANQREPAPLRHLRNRSRYLVDGTFWHTVGEIALVAAGILFNLLIVLPLPLAGALLTAVLFKTQWLGDYKWLDGTQWTPSWSAPLTGWWFWPAVGLFGGLMLYPPVKYWSLKILRKGAKPWLYAGWSWVMKCLAWWTVVLLAIWLIPLGFHLYYQIKTGHLGAWMSWLDKAKEYTDHLLAVFGLSLATLMGALAIRAKKGKSSSAWLNVVGMLSGPLLYLLVYFSVGSKLIEVVGAAHSVGDLAYVWSVAGVFVGLVLWATFLVNVNVYSPHGYYRDRLSNCYLITRAAHAPAPDSDKPIELPNGSRMLLSQTNATGGAPYHLINTTVNLPSTRLREMRGRNGDFFLLSKHYCGSPMCGYHKTTELEESDPHLDLGTAMAVSGAAASSNMGWQTNNSMRLLMTVANIRLGYWIRNPRRHTGFWNRPWSLYLFREMFAQQMDEDRGCLNLSDGGHIENLAVYELLRRRCKFIVCVDGGMEPDMQCIDLMRLERYAAIDLGVKMHYDVTDLYLQSNGFSRAYGVLVKIDYDPPGDDTKRSQRDPNGAKWGWMLYLKLAMVGYGPGYVMEYKRTHPEFPHQTTAEQIYDEERFEAYRALGEAAAESFFVPELFDESTPHPTLAQWFEKLAGALLPDNDEAVSKAKILGGAQ